jgi:pimeloyl-ACP methyl ester carboxylesterase
VIVIGFVGGFIRHNNLVHSEVQLATRLRNDYPTGVYIQVFENRRAEQAHAEILKLLDSNHDGKLSRDEKKAARIVIYGHSWGGSETVALARELQRDGVPVLLTIQVDSVAKLGEDDAVIPSNVAEAANFYQPNGLIHGRAEIRAADPQRTEILGNYRFNYSSKPVRCVGYPWYALAFEPTHIAIECDPTVIGDVESLIRSKLP